MSAHLRQAWAARIGGWRPDDPLPPGWRWAENEDGDPILIQPPMKYGPVMTEAQAKAKGWSGPFYHGTTPSNAASIRRQGFRIRLLEDYELEDWGTIEEVLKGDTIVVWFTEDETAARAYGGDAVMAYLRPGKYKPMAGVFSGEPALVVDDVANAAAIVDRRFGAKPNTKVTYTIEYNRKGFTDAHVIVQAKDAGKVVGTMSLHPRWEGRDVFSVWGVYVDPEYQRQGIATGMLKALHNAYPKHHIWHGGFSSDAGEAFAENTPPSWNRIKEDRRMPRKPRGAS